MMDGISVLLTNPKVAMQKLWAVPPWYKPRSAMSVDRKLSPCMHVFLHNDAVCSSLQPPYEGPLTKRPSIYPRFEWPKGQSQLKPAHLDTTPEPNSNATPWLLHLPPPPLLPGPCTLDDEYISHTDSWESFPRSLGGKWCGAQGHEVWP